MKVIPVAILTVMLAGCGGGGDDGDVVCRTNYGVYGDTTTCSFNDPQTASKPHNGPVGFDGKPIDGTGSGATTGTGVTNVTTTPITVLPNTATPVVSQGTQPQGYRTSF